jgi:hypothetical protein
VDFTLISYLATLLLSLVSIVVTGILIGVLGVQQVYGHIKAVKGCFIAGLIALIGTDIILLVRRVSPLDEASSIIAFRLMYSLALCSAAAMGTAATIIYRRPKSSTWKGVYADILRGMPLPFVSFMSILLVLFIFGWTVPLNVQLRSCATSYTELYVPILQIQHVISFYISFVAFLAYPAAVFLLASSTAENAAVTRDLEIFAICVIGLALSNYLQPFFLVGCFGEVVDIIRIPCFIVLTYVFRRITALQSFREVELREYMEHLIRGRKR